MYKRQELYRDAHSPNLFKVYMDDILVALEVAKLGVTVGKDAVSGLMFADDFKGVYRTYRSFRYRY